MQNRVFLAILIFTLFAQCFALFFQVDQLANNRVATKRICRNVRTRLTRGARQNGDESDADESSFLRCRDNEVIKIQDAVFGLTDLNVCPIKYTGEVLTGNLCDESYQTTQVIKRLCENKQKCKINIRQLNIPVVCPNEAGQYLQVQFSCFGNRIKFHPFAGNTFGGRLGDQYLIRGLTAESGHASGKRY